jgi:hypothetical protein
MADREEVEGALLNTLAHFGLEGYTDGVMDSLDTVIEWDDEEEEDDDD